MGERPPEDHVELFFVGNATLIIRYGPLTLLTDPNFLHRGEYAYLGHGLLSRRRTEPALNAAALPSDLDGVILSHLHGDHFDRRARAALPRSAPIITTPHAARRLQGLHGFHRATGLRTWQHHTLIRDGLRVTVTALPARHSTNRLAQALLPPVMGSLLEFGTVTGEPVLRLYLSGDTLLVPELQQIARRHQDIDLAVLHLGGTRIAGLPLTMDGSQGARLARMLAPRRILPVHHDDYTVMTSPLSDFLWEADRAGLADRVQPCLPGERVVVAREHATTAGGPWRRRRTATDNRRTP